MDEPERHLDDSWTGFVAGLIPHLAARPAGVIIATHSPVIAAACTEVIDLS